MSARSVANGATCRHSVGCSPAPAASTRATAYHTQAAGRRLPSSLLRPSPARALSQQPVGRRHAWAAQPASQRRRLRVSAWSPPSDADRDALEVDEECDYYSILGVSYTASADDIKRAYRRMAKEFHPDVSSDEASTEFAIFLNDVYDTLSDPEMRAAYDAIAGFEVGGVNPFRDASYEKDMVFVDEFSCIGCRNCHNVCPATFEMEDEWGRARVARQGVSGIDQINEAIETCPVDCISWVTAPQLALLEETMSRMERVAAWLLMTAGGKGANLNVFLEASIAWEKRQSALRAKAQAQTGWGAFRTNPAAGASMQESARFAQANLGLGRGVNAATVAASARRWRDYQRARRNRNQRLLGATTGVDVGAARETADHVA